MIKHDTICTPEVLSTIWDEIRRRGDKYGLSFSEPRIEIMTPEQMVINSVSWGLPNIYPHWSFGKKYIRQLESYLTGHSHVAFEQIIPSDPPLCYILENNSLAMQITVLIHAGVGHGSFFKENYMFKEWGNIKQVLNIVNKLSATLDKLENKYSSLRVEKLMDACHALTFNSFFKSKKPKELSKEQIKAAKKEAAEAARLSVDLRLNPKSKQPTPLIFQGAEQEHVNLLYYIAKFSKQLPKDMAKAVLLYVDLIQTLYPYFYTKVMNEGWASFWEYQIMSDMFDDGYIDDTIYVEYLATKGLVVYQSKGALIKERRHEKQNREFDINQNYHGLNPYHLGYLIFNKVKLKNIGGDWVGVLKDIMENYRDDTFIRQYLDDELIEELGLIEHTLTEFQVYGSYSMSTDTITAIHNETGCDSIRKTLATSYRLEDMIPQISIIENYDVFDNDLILKYTPYKNRLLDRTYAQKTIKHIEWMWGKGKVFFEDDVRTN